MILIDHETLDSDENGKNVMQNQELSEYKSKRVHETCSKYNFIGVNVKKSFLFCRTEDPHIVQLRLT